MLTPSQQRHTVAACFLSWTLDAFDFFIMVFVLADIAKEFGTGITAVTIAITLTLAARPLGALLFGYMADRIGRRDVLIVNVMTFSVFEFISGLAPCWRRTAPYSRTTALRLRHFGKCAWQCTSSRDTGDTRQYGKHPSVRGHREFLPFDGEDAPFAGNSLEALAAAVAKP